MQNGRSHGFSLLEVLLVLAIVAVAVAAALSLLGPSQENARAVAFARDISAIVENTRREYAAEENYAGLSNPMGIARGLFPSHMPLGAFQARDPWARTLALGPWPTTGAAQILNTQFTLLIFRPGEDACIPLALDLLRMDPAEMSITIPSAVVIVSSTVRPTAAAVAGLAQAACANNTDVGTGQWRLVFD
jgi:prepilin-type N-terminal cleavage/methylation domain-containing protein